MISFRSSNQKPILSSTGKDRIIFVTKEDHAMPSSAELVEEDPNDPYEERGEADGGKSDSSNGEINWNCPCLGGMASGPCGTEFKDAFSCFHYSKEEVKGSDCLEPFRAMQECMQRFQSSPQEEEKVEEEQQPGAEAPETLGTNSTSASEQHLNASQPNTESSEGR
ncbi:hypothetical protein INR49_011948 [Caranx melampygus]|nr:hypothetical protein INR49_011948 [Caranx melampygus]